MHCVHGTHLIFNFKERISENAAPFSFYFTNVETSSNDPHGEEYIEPSLLFCLMDYVNINMNHNYKNHIMCGWSSFRAYLNALMFLIDHQKDSRYNKNGEIKKLVDLVKTRDISLAKSNLMRASRII
jgi:hypothetical protein